MKVFVFKPTNEPIGKFEVETLELQDLEQALAKFSESNAVALYDYLECSDRTWTVVGDEAGFQLVEERIRPEREAPGPGGEAAPSMEFRYKERYGRASFAITCGAVLKVLALLIAIGVFVYSLDKGSEVFPKFARPSVWQAILAAISAGAPVFIAGIVVGTLGDIHQTNLDIAVQGSPYLSEEERARLLKRTT